MDVRSAVWVRVARESDAALLAELGATTFAETFAADNTTQNLRSYIEDNFRDDIQARDLADSSVCIFIAEQQGCGAVGYAKLQRGDTPACVPGNAAIEIVRIYVRASAIGLGLGALLMNACLDRARELGADVVWLGVWERNTRAIDFYRRFGFAECGDHVFVLGEDPQRDLVMTRRVSDAG